jgi:hypothetical protein
VTDTLIDLSAFFNCFTGLPPAQVLKLADSPKTLVERLRCLADACSEQAKSPNESLTNEFLTRLKPRFISLVESKPSDLDIWTAVADLLMIFNSPAVPETSSTPTSVLTLRGYGDTANHALLLKLHHKWTREYLPGSLEALRDVIRRNGQRIAGGLKIYARTLLFVQSTGMGKSRLADKFGEMCPMINFTLGEAKAKCYPPVDSEVLLFLYEELSERAKATILDSPRKEKISSRRPPERSESKMSTPKTPKLQLIEGGQKMTTERPTSNKAEESLPVPREDTPSQSSEEETERFFENMATTVWNHTRAAAFLQACFEVCKLRQLFII